MDIDKDFIRGLGIPPDEPQPKPKIGNIDVELPEENPASEPKLIAETPDEAIQAMNGNPLMGDKAAESVKIEETASIVVETTTQVDGSESSDEKSVSLSPTSEEMLGIISAIGDNVLRLLEDISEVKASVSRFDGYDKAVETLKRSLAANQRNEDNIYKELETYKKNQYFNYIRPFLEFLINLLTDMLTSKKQYEDDQVEFIAQHGQDVYDEIIELHQYYTQQIESQLQIQGVEIIHYEPETAFIPTEQIISKTISTEDTLRSGKIGKVDSACYKFEDKVLKKAKVHVYKAKPADNNN